MMLGKCSTQWMNRKPTGCEMRDLNDVLEVYALWIRNGKAICSRELAYISEGEAVQSGECIGMRKLGCDGAYFSDLLNIVDYIYMHELSATQRSVVAMEYGMTSSPVMPKSQKAKAAMLNIQIGRYKTQLFRARRVIQMKMAKPKPEYYKGAKSRMILL